jgi:hypothetical protein
VGQETTRAAEFTGSHITDTMPADACPVSPYYVDPTGHKEP